MAVLAPLRTQLRADLSGQRYGRLVVVSPLGTRHGKVHWLCACDCGGQSVVATGSLRSGHIRSCGCLYAESRHTAHATHGMSQTPEYRVWKSMITRCENPRRDFYHRYGARGIRVCDAWRHSSETFLADMGPRPTPSHMIERVNNDGDYEPANCKWATAEEQGQNTSRTRKITINGETMGVLAWSRRLRMSRKTILAKFG